MRNVGVSNPPLPSIIFAIADQIITNKFAVTINVILLGRINVADLQGRLPERSIDARGPSPLPISIFLFLLCNI